MSDRRYLPLACVLLLFAREAASAAQGAPPTPPASAFEARIALTSNALKRCPALRTASEGDPEVALVVFLVGPSGVPSRPSAVSSSGSQQLDAAAVSCVLKLRFQPATRLGDGTAVESWQQMGWTWAPAGRPTGAATAGPAASDGATPGRPTATAVAAVSDAVEHGVRAVPADHGAEVRVCVDANGKLTAEPKLTRASGDSQFDAAALNVARSGSGYYRPATADGKPVPGCVRLAISASAP